MQPINSETPLWAVSFQGLTERTFHHPVRGRLGLGQEPKRHDTLTEALTHFDPNAYLSLNQDLQAQYGANAGTALEHFKNFGYWQKRRYFSWPFETVDFPISLTEPTVVNGQVVLLNGRLLSTGGSNSVKVGFAISSEGLLPRYDLGWEVHQAALNPQNGFSHAYQPLKSNTTYYYRAYAENEAGRWFGSVKNSSPHGLRPKQTQYSSNLVPSGTAGMKTRGSVFSIYRQTDGLTTWTWMDLICLRTTKMVFGYGQRNAKVGFGPNRTFGLTFGNITKELGHISGK